MSIIQTLDADLTAITSSNILYGQNIARWKFLLESYLGGEDYRRGNHLTRYQLESESEYVARLRATPLENHCKSVVSVYNSFLFREEPDREFGPLTGNSELESFLDDADFDGRSLNQFMKDVSTWSNVFGHCWIVLAKPAIGAVTRADEMINGVRPYATLITPMSMLDWSWTRNPNGSYSLDGIKYIEDVNGSIRTIKQWTRSEIRTWVVDVENETVNSDFIEPNGLGEIPAVCAYSSRSLVRGIGISTINDIADAQKFIYNSTSEVDQSIRLDSHPSLVKTPETQAGAGAGSLIHIPDNLDPGLKPYILEYSGASVAGIYSSIKHTIESIDKMANTGAVRATESRTMSGVAMETEFQLLNARLSEMADGLELAEEQMWKIWAAYQGTTWSGSVEYPGSFSIRDTKNEYQQLATAKTAASDPRVLAVIDHKIVDLLGEEPNIVLGEEPGETPATETAEARVEGYEPTELANLETGEVQLAQTIEQYQSLLEAGWVEVD